MNELEKAISSSDDELNVYLENVETEDFRAQVKEIIQKWLDTKADIKARLHVAIDLI